MNDRSVSQLAADLSQGTAEARLETCQELAALGEDASPAAVALVGATADPELLEWAAEALENLGPPPVEALDELGQQLVHKSPDAAYWAATLLGRLGAAGAPAAPALVQALEQSPHASVRERAAWALGELGPAAASAVGALEQASGGDARLARLAEAALASVRG